MGRASQIIASAGDTRDRAPDRRAVLAAGVLGLAGLTLAACSSGGSVGDLFPAAPPAAAPQANTALGTGQIKVALLLPLSAPGNAGIAAVSMRNAAELALTEFANPNIQLLVKDDGGSVQQAQQMAEQAIGEGAEIILGPLFAQTVAPVAQVARARGIPVIAFSTDTNVAARGVYLLSFLPESDVNRITDYAVGSGKRSFLALVPDNSYGSVVEAAFNQAVGRHRARVATLQRYSQDRNQQTAAVRAIAQAARGADALFLPDGAEGLRTIMPILRSSGLDLKRLQFLGTGLWEDPQIFSDPELQGGWYPAPDPTGFRNFSGRYRAKYGQEPVRTATLAYDSVALVAALAKTQGAQRFAEPTLTNPSGFTGIDGLFRFRPDGTNQRGLAVMRVTQTGGQIISPAPRAFGSGT